MPSFSPRRGVGWSVHRRLDYDEARFAERIGKRVSAVRLRANAGARCVARKRSFLNHG